MRERCSCMHEYDLLVRGGQPGLAFGEHDTCKKKSVHSVNNRFPNGAFLGLLTESPVNVLDEHTAKVIRDRRETATANHQALALRRVMREAAVCREY